jgi:hypothetical protein
MELAASFIHPIPRRLPRITKYGRHLLHEFHFPAAFPPVSVSRPASNSDFEDDSQKQLKQIFPELIVGRQRFCDTQRFCSCWKGWNKQLIDPRE